MYTVLILSRKTLLYINRRKTPFCLHQSHQYFLAALSCCLKNTFGLSLLVYRMQVCPHVYKAEVSGLNSFYHLQTVVSHPPWIDKKNHSRWQTYVTNENSVSLCIYTGQNNSNFRQLIWWICIFSQVLLLFCQPIIFVAVEDKRPLGQ